MATFVLVHGAGTGGWLWDDVASRLRSDGHQVFAPSLRGVGGSVASTKGDSSLTTHADQVVELVEHHDLTEITLVGFSYGGFVTTVAGARLRTRLARLVYLDAFMPRAGQSFLDVLPEPVRNAFVDAAQAHGGGRLVPPTPLEAIGGIGALEAGVSVEHVLRVLARRAGHPLASYAEMVPAADAEPPAALRTFIVSTDTPSTDPLLALAKNLKGAGWDVRELHTGHFAMLTMPTALTRLLVDLVGTPRSSTEQKETRSGRPSQPRDGARKRVLRHGRLDDLRCPLLGLVLCPVCNGRVKDGHTVGLYHRRPPSTTAVNDRGYREAQLRAGIVEGRLHMTAYAVGVGACG